MREVFNMFDNFDWLVEDICLFGVVGENRYKV